MQDDVVDGDDRRTTIIMETEPRQTKSNKETESPYSLWPPVVVRFGFLAVCVCRFRSCFLPLAPLLLAFTGRPL